MKISSFKINFISILFNFFFHLTSKNSIVNWKYLEINSFLLIFKTKNKITKQLSINKKTLRKKSLFPDTILCLVCSSTLTNCHNNSPPSSSPLSPHKLEIRQTQKFAIAQVQSCKFYLWRYQTMNCGSKYEAWAKVKAIDELMAHSTNIDRVIMYRT